MFNKYMYMLYYAMTSMCINALSTLLVGDFEDRLIIKPAILLRHLSDK